MMAALTQNPYVRLMRFDRPIGTYLLLWPTLWALWIAAEGTPALHNIAIFVAGVVVMRAAGCVINDYADRKLDGHVERTKMRPIPAGDVSPQQAITLFLGLLLLAFLLVCLTDRQTIQLAFVGAILATSYPFMKRFHHLPQIVLGLCWAWCVPMIFSAQTGDLPSSLWWLFGGIVCWTIAFDTFYAIVDRDDDLAMGMKSTAILFGRYDLLIIGLFQCLALLLLAVAGNAFSLGIGWYLGLAAAAVMFARQQWIARRRDRDQCFAAFLNNNHVGGILFVGLLADIYLR